MTVDLGFEDYRPVDALKHCLHESALSALRQLHLCPQLMEDVDNDAMFAADQLNVIVCFESGIRGYALVSLSRRAATTVISMMKGNAIIELEEEGRDALGDLCSRILCGALVRVNPNRKVRLSSPTIVEGEDIILLRKIPGRDRLVFSCRGCKITFVIARFT